MPTVKIPIFTDVVSNVDRTVAKDELYQLIDAYIDEKGGYNRRPGLASFYDFGGGTGTPMDGVYWWDEKGFAVAVHSGSVYKLSYVGGIASITNLTSATLQVGAKVSFATDGNYIFMANGGRIVFTNGVAPTAYIVDPNAPLSVSHLAFLDGFLLANLKNTNQFRFSETTDPFTWSGDNYASAVAYPDNITGLYVQNNELYLPGSASLEIWQNDATTPLAPVQGGASSVGMAAPHSACQFDIGMIFLDNRRKFNSFNGKNIQRLVSPFDTEISNYSTVADCTADRMDIGVHTFAIFHFPTANTTIVYNLLTEKWCKFARWNENAAQYERWMGNTICYAKAWNKVLVGSRISPKIFYCDTSVFTDDGSLIRDARLSGHINHGTLRRKRCTEMRFGLKRGSTTGSSSPQVMLRWLTDNKNWSQEHVIDLGASGDYYISRRLKAQGIFVSRQYELSCTEPVSIVQSDAEQDVDIL